MNFLDTLRESYDTLEVHEIPTPNEVPLLLGALCKAVNSEQNAAAVQPRATATDTAANPSEPVTTDTAANLSGPATTDTATSPDNPTTTEGNA